MPLPTAGKGEEQDDFISRCMDSESYLQCWYAWTAGIIDGEGSVGIPRSNSNNKEEKYRYRVSICVRNTDKKMIDKLVELWGGRTEEKKYDKRYEAKRVWGWFLPASKTIEFVNKILPYSITKKQQLLNARELAGRIRQRKGVIMVDRFSEKGHRLKSMYLTDEEREIRRNIRYRNHLLNRNGRFAYASS